MGLNRSAPTVVALKTRRADAERSVLNYHSISRLGLRTMAATVQVELYNVFEVLLRQEPHRERLKRPPKTS